MGAIEFIDIGYGETAQEAFDVLVEQALYDCGHAGYTGTIAEKDEFIVVDLPEGKDPKEYAQYLIDKDERFDNKWGPAGCLRTDSNEWIFFGWASY